MQALEDIQKGEHDVLVSIEPLSGVIEVATPQGKPIIIITPRGVTKKAHEESKQRRKMARKSRRANLRK
jgi:hypothetical protein